MKGSEPVKTNIGSTDRLIRVLIGFGIIALGVIFKSWWGLLGLIPILTAVTGFCSFYIPFGISTCRSKKES